MTGPKSCKFHRYSGTTNMGHGFGYCDLDGDQTTCGGVIDSCPKPVALKTYLFAQVKKEGCLEWVRRRNTPFQKT